MHRCHPSRGSNSPLQPPALRARPGERWRGEYLTFPHAHSAHTTNGKVHERTRAFCAPRRWGPPGLAPPSARARSPGRRPKTRTRPRPQAPPADTESCSPLRTRPSCTS
eukprot:3315161-Alexandrium_andersonii.AAC.1